MTNGAILRTVQNLQWGRVVIDAESWVRFVLGFDGNATVLQWGRVVIDAESVATTDDLEDLGFDLQWGRVVIDAESFRTLMQRSHNADAFNGAAS